MHGESLCGKRSKGFVFFFDRVLIEVLEELFKEVGESVDIHSLEAG